jgi:hypothetical protein
MSHEGRLLEDKVPVTADDVFVYHSQRNVARNCF